MIQNLKILLLATFVFLTGAVSMAQPVLGVVDTNSAEGVIPGRPIHLMEGSELATIYQDSTDASAQVQPNVLATSLPEVAPEHMKNSLILSISTLIFGFLIVIGILVVLLMQKKGFGSNIIQLIGIIMIISSSLFLMTAGYSAEQIAPIIGLLGTIAGYLLGKSGEKGG